MPSALNEDSPAAKKAKASSVDLSDAFAEQVQACDDLISALATLQQKALSNGSRCGKRILSMLEATNCDVDRAQVICENQESKYLVLNLPAAIHDVEKRYSEVQMQEENLVEFQKGRTSSENDETQAGQMLDKLQGLVVSGLSILDAAHALLALAKIRIEARADIKIPMYNRNTWFEMRASYHALRRAIIDARLKSDEIFTNSTFVYAERLKQGYTVKAASAELDCTQRLATLEEMPQLLRTAHKRRLEAGVRFSTTHHYVQNGGRIDEEFGHLWRSRELLLGELGAYELALEKAAKTVLKASVKVQ